MKITLKSPNITYLVGKFKDLNKNSFFIWKGKSETPEVSMDRYSVGFKNTNSYWLSVNDGFKITIEHPNKDIDLGDEEVFVLYLEETLFSPAMKQ